MPTDTQHRKIMNALDAQMDLIKWWTTPVGMSYGMSFMDQVVADGKSTNRYGSQRGHERFGKEEAHRLSHSPLYWVSSEMVDLLEVAHKKIPPKRIFPEDLPSPRGFIYLQRPIHITDRNGEPLGVTAIGWSHSPLRFGMGGDPVDIPQGGISLSFYTHSDDPLDHSNVTRREEGDDILDRYSTKLTMSHYVPWPIGSLYSFREDGNYGMNVPVWDQEEPMQDFIDRLRAEEEQRDPPDYDSQYPGTSWLPLMDCLWTLLGQRITMVGRHQPDRAVSRRAQRIKFSPEINVVTLRKRDRIYPDRDPDHEPMLVDWSCRWIVDGFWRWQWRPSLNRHVRTWIDPFIKGPPDRPLKVKDKVYAFVR